MKASPNRETVTGAPDSDGPPTLGPLAAESIPGGRYVIVERLAAGAVGSVYKALDTILDRPVAVKSIRLDTPFAEQSADELRERFVREARIAARLHHPNIVTTYDIVATGDRGYIIMEFIEGMTLDSLMRQEGRLGFSQALDAVSQLASALDYAHAHNVVHRDVKPSNVLVSPEMNVWITDFGIAKSELSTNLTMAGGVIGTPDYMSPEQAQGQDVDARSDLYSLGCILFESVLGERPFRASSLTGVLLAIINDGPTFPEGWSSLGLPSEIEGILRHALEKRPEARYTSGAELLAALDAIPEAAVQRADELFREQKAAMPREEARPPSEPDPDPQPETEVDPESEARDSEDWDTEEIAADRLKGEDLDTSSDGLDTTEMNPPPELDGAQDVPEAEAEASPGSPMEDAPESGAETESDEEPEDDAGAARARADEEDTPEPETSAGEIEDHPHEAQEVEVNVDVHASATYSTAEPEDEAARAAVDGDLHPDRLRELKDSEDFLVLSPSISHNLQGVEISPEEGFLLSRIDGASRPREILSLSPLPEAKTAGTILDLLDKGLVLLESAAPAPKDPPGAEPTSRNGRPDPETLAEVERLLGLAVEADHEGLLGVDLDTPTAAMKSAYLNLMARFHPDRFPGMTDAVFQGKLSRLCAALSEALTELATRAAKRKDEQAYRPTNGAGGAAGPAGEGESPFDKRRYARDLYDRALRSYEVADYWDVVQLCQQAIEIDDSEAEFFFLLGRALMQNRRWRKDAAQNFRKATELAPTNVEYLGVLSALYKSEGLHTRSSKLLEKARAIDPDYALPELEHEA